MCWHLTGWGRMWFTIPQLCCMVWSWQPAYVLTGSEFSFSGSVISTNFLRFRSCRPRSLPLLFQPGSADSTEETAIRHSEEILTVHKQRIQGRRTEKSKADKPQFP
ncbi:hypothetical protein GOODEAATRI_006332 [Goodea atripinnis]|uniref:Secreted protein n=1 Tax=Goodea atripinnis TaxID=208336 RepID=A0ABV0MPS1_9TELE